jgi:multidrug transporter EmrE-like cation transporter
LWLKEYLSVMGLIGFALIVCGVTLMLYTSKRKNT